jgi:hypothetical protein
VGAHQTPAHASCPGKSIVYYGIIQFLKSLCIKSSGSGGIDILLRIRIGVQGLPVPIPYHFNQKLKLIFFSGKFIIFKILEIMTSMTWRERQTNVKWHYCE